MRILLILLVLITFDSCKKEKGVPVMEANPDFQGVWHWAEIFEISVIEDGRFKIESNSQGEYSFFDGATETGYGPATILDNVLKIGYREFRIDKAPTELNTISGKWKVCTLDGEDYYSGDALEYEVTRKCSEYQICFWNSTADPINATVNNTFRVIDTTTGYCFPVENIGTLINYSDDRGNNFSYHAVECNQAVVIQ